MREIRTYITIICKYINSRWTEFIKRLVTHFLKQLAGFVPEVHFYDLFCALAESRSKFSAADSSRESLRQRLLRGTLYSFQRVSDRLTRLAGMSLLHGRSNVKLGQCTGLQFLIHTRPIIGLRLTQFKFK